jgi:hypothetical protein
MQADDGGIATVNFDLAGGYVRFGKWVNWKFGN